MEITIFRYQHLIESNMTINQRPDNHHPRQAHVLRTWYVDIRWDRQHILAPSGKLLGQRPIDALYLRYIFGH